VKILVLGGTILVGRAMAEAGLRGGHEVTAFNRGVSGSPVEGVRVVRGDRTVSADLEQLRGLEFDLVLDTGYFPDQVRAAAELLEPTTGHSAFVSTINTYPGWPSAADYHSGGVHDGDPDAVGDALPDAIGEEQAYGWRKVGAERAVMRAFGGGRTSILRAGLIFGPHDRVGRLPWWLDRMARGGEVLVPGSPSQHLRLIDARDIAAFALLRPSGTFETTGPDGQISRGEFFDLLREVTCSDARLTWVGDEFLAGQDVEEWTEIPLWTDPQGSPSLFRHDTGPAEAAGLACRPVRETVADVWAWMQSIEGGWQVSDRTPGLAPAKEADLIARWRADRAAGVGPWQRIGERSGR